MHSDEFQRLYPGDLIAIENQSGSYMVQGRTREGGVIAVRTVVAYKPEGWVVVGSVIPVAPNKAVDPWAHREEEHS